MGIEKNEAMIAAIEKRADMGMRTTALETRELIAAYREMEKKAYLKVPKWTLGIPRYSGKKRGW